ILLAVLSFATHRDTKEVKTVRHSNSVFHDLLKLVPWTAFDRLVGEQGSDEGTRSFTSRQHLSALLFAQFSGASSLREIEATMASHQGRLYHCGAVAPKRSTFADANLHRDFRVFSGLFGAKAHVVYDPDLGRPVYHAVTAANVNDITAAREMPIEAGATYVFDLGYYDFSFWARLDALGCRLVTRFKTNTPLNSPREMPLEPGSTALSDRIGFLPARQAMNRKNPMQDAVREIVVRTEAGETLRLLTNDLDAPAREIADLYKRRWRIELFFRLMKQTLRITKFIGRSENAVRIQIAVALIAFLLLRALQQIGNDACGFLELVRLVRANLMHRKDPTRLRNPPPPPPLDSRQLQLSLALT